MFRTRRASTCQTWMRRERTQYERREVTFSETVRDEGRVVLHHRIDIEDERVQCWRAAFWRSGESRRVKPGACKATGADGRMEGSSAS